MLFSLSASKPGSDYQKQNKTKNPHKNKKTTTTNFPASLQLADKDGTFDTQQKNTSFPSQLRAEAVLLPQKCLPAPAIT